MRRTRGGQIAPLFLVGLVVAVGLLGSACEAPLAPKSRTASTPSTAPPAATTTAAQPVRPTQSTPTRTARPRAKKSAPPAPPSPSLTVPGGLERPRRSSAVVLGADAGWPQCPRGMGIPQKRSMGSPMPLGGARFVILGVTNGPGFYRNPCLADQTAWVRQRHLLGGAYSVISWPDAVTLRRYGGRGPYDGSTRLGALSNVGYQQALFNLATMKEAGLVSPVVWLDVEPVPEFDWSDDVVANAAVVSGAARGYTDAGSRIGAYSTHYLWRSVVGELRLGVPEWRAAGQTSRAEALRRCGRSSSFQGGPSVISQWVEQGRGQNVTCPGTSSAMSAWFHQY